MDDGGRDDDAAWAAYEARAWKRIRDEEDPENPGLEVRYEGRVPIASEAEMEYVRTFEKAAEAEAARQREMAVLRHKRIRAEQAPSGSGAPVGHFQQDYRPPSSYPTPSVPGSPRTWREKHEDEKERQDAKDRWDIFKNNPGSFGA
jgi:hypothetical protein